MYTGGGCFTIAENSNGKVKARVLSRSLLGGWQQQGSPGRARDLWKLKKLGSKSHHFSITLNHIAHVQQCGQWASGQ